MNALIEIPKANKELDNFPCWVVKFDSEGKQVRPLIICQCGENTSIENHHIHYDGRITESYFHRNGCGWHVLLKLKDWSNLEFKPGNDYHESLYIGQDGLFPCDNCMKKFKTESELMEHIRNSTRCQLVACPRCFKMVFQEELDEAGGICDECEAIEDYNSNNKHNKIQ